MFLITSETKRWVVEGNSSNPRHEGSLPPPSLLFRSLDSGLSELDPLSFLDLFTVLQVESPSSNAAALMPHHLQ